MKYCTECGEKLTEKYLKNEGMIPYCTRCGVYRFPIYSVAVSMEVLHPNRDKVLLIQQYGKGRNVLVAGYVNRGETAEDAVRREVREEIGLEVTEVRFNKSEFFEPSNTLMLNFSCVAADADLSGASSEEIDACRWFSLEEAREEIAKNSLAKRFLLYYLDK